MTLHQNEDDLQRAVAQLLDFYGWLWFHTPNGGKRGKVQASRLKGLGVKPGVPDVMILEPWAIHPETAGPVPGGLYFSVTAARDQGSPDGSLAGRGVAIELKSEAGRVRPEQKDWIRGLVQRGWLTAVCSNLDQVFGVLSFVQPTNGRRL